jgi:threonine dehydratase
VRVLGAEPETAAPYALSLREGRPQRFTSWTPSFVDGAGGKSVTDRMWTRMRPVTDGTITVTLAETRDAIRLIAERSRTIAEGAGALALAAALTGKAGEGPIACVVSGGNIDLETFAELVAH